jgi:hypothetical protein
MIVLYDYDIVIKNSLLNQTFLGIRKSFSIGIGIFFQRKEAII